MRTNWPVVSVVAISLLQVLVVLLGGPLLIGLMRKVRCLWVPKTPIDF